MKEIKINEIEDKEVRNIFRSLDCQLSPENLYCDGEISEAQARRRYQQIMKCWEENEKILGYKVMHEC